VGAAAEGDGEAVLIVGGGVGLAGCREGGGREGKRKEER